MSPRKRSKKNVGIEPNLYPRLKNGVIYYEYQRPDTGKTFGMGTDKAEAQKAAKQLNARLMPGQGLVAKVIGSNSVAGVVKLFQKEMVDNDPDIAEGTKREKRYRLNRIKTEIGHLAISTVETITVVEFLSKLTGDSYRQHRSVLSQLMDFAISKGLITHNPVTPTQKKLKGIAKARSRLTKEAYLAIREIAPEWFRVAMDLSLLMCLGRNEVANLKFSDEKDGVIYVVRKKVEKYESSHIAVRITPALREVLSRAKALPPLSQYVVHKSLRTGRRGAIKPEMITREFKKLADDSKIFAGMAPGEQPTFHEIRSLGSHILKEVEKRETADIRSLMAHASDNQTIEYLDGHGTKWVEATAGNTVIW